MRTLALGLACLFAGPAVAAERPNVLWIVSEDNGPQLGCYGDAYADTPNIDALAADGLRYDVCWSNAPVCAPARTTLMTGLYATSAGAEHMRSLVKLPDGMKLFPQLLREAGYFTTNARKEDFNVENTGTLWDVPNDADRPWRKRTDGRPFFSMINIPTSHESQLRKRPHTPVHDPANVRIPAYHPDAPEVRRDWAQYYDKLTEMDREVGAILARLAEDGLKDETVVFYFGDHGSGMPRSKRSAMDSGLHVPLVIRIPEKFKTLRPDDYKPGGSTGRLVAFVDFAPTALSLAGVQAADYHQGVAFLGEHAGPPHEFLHGYRGRMDERTDLVRSVADGRFVYVRNYLPHLPGGQHVGYMFQTPTTQVWKRLYDEGKLNAAQQAFWKPRSAEELYDLESDPDETANLVGSSEKSAVLQRLRDAQRQQVARVRDVGFLPEAMLHARCAAAGLTPYGLGHDPDKYPLDRIVAAATASAGSESLSDYMQHQGDRLGDADAAVRFWTLTGLIARSDDVSEQAASAAGPLLADSSPSVRIAAAELLGRAGDDQDAEKAVAALLKEADYHTSGVYAATAALQALDALQSVRPMLVAPHAAAIAALPEPQGKGINPRAKEYPARLKATLGERLTER